MPDSQFDIAWRPQNAMASKAVQRRVKATEAEREKSTRADLVRPQSPSVPRVLPQDYENYAVSFFFNSYILRTKSSSIQNGYLDCLYPVWMLTSPTSPLRPAVNAVAMCLLEAWSRLNPNSPQSLARSHYVTGIEALRSRLRSSEDIDDDVLMASLMLHMYDGIMAFCGARPPGGPHMTGSKAMIRNRRRLPITNEISRRIMLGARGQIVGQALRKREPVSEDELSWKTSTPTSYRTPPFELEEIEIEVANLQASVLKIAGDLPNKHASALEVLAQANDLDQRLMNWIGAIPAHLIPTCIWNPGEIPLSVREAGLYQGHCTIHESIFTANLLNIHCCTRIRVQLAILACLEHLKDPIFDITRADACNSIQDLADTVCASIPYHLGDRVEVRRFDDKGVQYPHVGSGPVPAEHYPQAAAYAGIFLTQRLSELLQPGLPLRASQREWIIGQMQRVKRVYLATPHKAS